MIQGVEREEVFKYLGLEIKLNHKNEILKLVKSIIIAKFEIFHTKINTNCCSALRNYLYQAYIGSLLDYFCVPMLAAGVMKRYQMELIEV